MNIEPYLTFNGRCEEAIEFYEKTLDAKRKFMMRFNESPDPEALKDMDESMHKKIMHSVLEIGGSSIMASDGCGAGEGVFSGIALTLVVDSDAKAEKYFDALAQDGTIEMKLGKTFFAHKYGMVKDKFGVHWVVIHPSPMEGQ